MKMQPVAFDHPGSGGQGNVATKVNYNIIDNGRAVISLSDNSIERRRRCLTSRRRPV